MNTGNTIFERRKHERFKIKKGLCVALKPDNRVGQIKEISRGGLVFHNIDNDKTIQNPDRIDIFSSGYDFYLRNIPVKASIHYRKNKTGHLRPMPIKHLNIQVNKITPTQKMLLLYFLKEYILLNQ
jgi:hypothetical protein